MAVLGSKSPIRSYLTRLSVAALVVGSPAPPPDPCEGPDAPQWVVDMYGRTLQFNDLAAFATSTFGEPVSCEGAVTSEFDGVDYGFLTLEFPSGVRFRVETMPIETGIQTLESQDGFAEPAGVMDAFRASVDDVGVAVDWTEGTSFEEDGLRIEEFQDPDDGLNAIARFYYRGEALIRVRFSLAL